jgi:hypothetical protein
MSPLLDPLQDVLALLEPEGGHAEKDADENSGHDHRASTDRPGRVDDGPDD